MPKPREGESQKEFVSRCIPIVLQDGTAKDQQQAAAVCYSLFREGKKSMSIKHGAGDHAPFSAKEMDHLQSIHNHSHDLGAKHPGEGEDGEEAAKHGKYDGAQKADKIQAMHDHASELGANCDAGHLDAEEAADELKASRYIKEMLAMPGMEVEDNPPEDIRTAAYAIVQLAALIESEDDEPEDLKLVADTIRNLCEFIDTELKEAEGGEDMDEEGEGKHLKIARRKDVNPKRGKTEYGNVTFADEKNKKYPIDTEEHIRAAWNYIHKGNNAGKYSAEDVSKIKARIASAWRAKIDKAGPPSAEGKSFAQVKELDLSYAKSLGIQYPDMPELAVKFVGRDEIKGYTFLWGNPEKLDIEREYFTPETDFWDATQKGTRPLTWDHGQDASLKADTRIGEIKDYGDDEIGRWYAAKLDRSHKYHDAIADLIKQGVLGTSSDSAPQYVIRQKTGKATWLKQWPWFASALTDVPCEPRMIGSIEVLKSWGIHLPEAGGDRSREIEMLQMRAARERVRSNNFRK